MNAPSGDRSRPSLRSARSLHRIAPAALVYGLTEAKKGPKRLFNGYFLNFGVQRLYADPAIEMVGAAGLPEQS